MIAMVAPVTPVARLFRLQPLEGRGCPPSLTEVVMRIDRETQTLAVVNGKPNRGFLPFQVSIDTLRSDPDLAAWWYGKDFQALSPGVVVIHGVQRLRENFGTVIPLLSATPLPSQPSDSVSICASRSQVTSLAGTLYYQVESVRLLTPRRDP